MGGVGTEIVGRLGLTNLCPSSSKEKRPVPADRTAQWSAELVFMAEKGGEIGTAPRRRKSSWAEKRRYEETQNKPTGKLLVPDLCSRT